MPVYYALIKGDGEGCDYTIGCNMRWKRLKATTLDGAKEESLFPDGRRENSCVVGEYNPVDSITILEVAAATDLAQDIAVLRDKHRRTQELTQTAKKLLEFERLRKELGV